MTAGTLEPIPEPRADLSPATKLFLTLAMLLLLVVFAGAFHAESLPLVALVIAILPVGGPLWPRRHLPLGKYVATTVTSVNGALLTFVASLALGAAAQRSAELTPSDADWIGALFGAAFVSAIGAGVLVRRVQLRDGHERWVETRILRAEIRALGGARYRFEDRPAGVRRVLVLLVTGAVAWVAHEVGRRSARRAGRLR